MVMKKNKTFLIFLTYFKINPNDFSEKFNLKYVFFLKYRK